MISEGPVLQTIDNISKGSPKPVDPKLQRAAQPSGENTALMSAQLLAVAQADSAAQLQEFASRLEGLSQAEVDRVFGNIIKYIKMATSSNFDYLTFVSSLVIVVVGACLTVSPLAGALGFVPLPPLYWVLLAIMLPCYVVLAQLRMTWFYRRFGG